MSDSGIQPEPTPRRHGAGKVAASEAIQTPAPEARAPQERSVSGAWPYLFLLFALVALAAGVGAIVFLWPRGPETREPPVILPGNGWVGTLAFSPDSDLLAGGWTDGPEF